MSPFIFPGLPKVIQRIEKHGPYLESGAKPLYEAVMSEIDKLGGIKLTLDYILLENPKTFGFKEREIKARIRSRINTNESKGSARKTYQPKEIIIALNNKHLTANELGQILNRSQHSVNALRRKLKGNSR